MKARLAALILVLCLPLALSRADSDEQEYIVVLRDGQSIAAVNKAYGTHTIRGIPHTSIYLIGADQDQQPGSADVLIKRLKADRNIDIVEKNGRVKLKSADETPLDRSLVQQMASLLDGQTLTTFYGTSVLNSYVNQPAVEITHLTEARTLSTGVATHVAYVDTGVDFYHPALRPWLDPGVDLVNNRTASEFDGLSQAMASLLDQQMASLLDKRFVFVLSQAMASLLDGDDYSATFPSALGHGTLVAGIIHLYAPEARIVPIKAFDAYGNTTMFTIVEGVYRARDLNVDVLNMSFSINGDSEVLQKALADIRARGIATVASVGNDGIDARNMFPSAYPGVIGVAATDFNDHVASFSNFGKSVSVSAPGAYIVSTVPGGRYAAAWGTSFSAPIITGTIALIASRGGRAQANSAAAVTTADFIDDLNPGFENKLGKGRVNVGRALGPRN